MQNKEIEKRGGQHQVREDDDQEARASKEIEAWKEDYQEIKRKLPRKTFTMPELMDIVATPAHPCHQEAVYTLAVLGAQTLEPQLQAESSPLEPPEESHEETESGWRWARQAFPPGGEKTHGMLKRGGRYEQERKENKDEEEPQGAGIKGEATQDENREEEEKFQAELTEFLREYDRPGKGKRKKEGQRGSLTRRTRRRIHPPGRGWWKKSMTPNRGVPQKYGNP